MPFHRRAQARAFVRLFSAAGVLGLAVCGPCAYSAGQPVVPPTNHRYVRTYAAAAYVSFLSVTIFSRTGVGFGTASAEEEVSPAERVLNLQFLSGSIPSRAHGLNRFGFIQEIIHEREHKFAQADYFGLITASGEESLAQAKAALDTTAGDKTQFVAAQATIDPLSARYAVRHMSLPSSYRGSNAEQLLSEVRASFLLPEAGQPDHQQALHGHAMGTFLYSVRQAMLSAGPVSDAHFLYNGKTFNLHAEKRHDQKTGVELLRAKVAVDSSSVTELDGKITNQQTGELTTFRLWFDNAAPDLLPLRFEFHPKSFLKLVFTAVPQPEEGITKVAEVN
jgi:hypothetical protein